MLYTVQHVTRYAYSSEVFLEPHTIRLRPRSDGSQDLRYFALRVNPAPAGRTDTLDAENNAVSRVWFNGVTPELTIETRFQVVTRRTNPFDFILGDRSARLPLIYSRDLADQLAPYRRRADVSSPSGEDDPVAEFAHDVAREAGYDTLAFLTALTHRMQGMMRIEIRDDGAPFAPAQTLVTRCGACRDLTVLFMDACRVMGLAARFVSGYQEGDPDTPRRELHAWAGVYLPLAGWRGYDPTLGLVVADRHVAVCASVDPEGSSPVAGTLRGTGATTKLTHEIRMTAAPDPVDVDPWKQAGQQQQQ